MRNILLLIMFLLMPISIIACSKSMDKERKEVEPVLSLMKTNCDDGVRKLTAMAEAGNSCAQYNLGVFYLGKIVKVECIKPNKDLAIKWLEASAKKKNDDAYTMLGGIYEGDAVVRRDLGKAFHYYELGVESKNKIAMNKLGVMYLKGHGCAKDVDKALSLLKSASDLGHYESSMMLGSIYASGSFGEKNYDTALQYLKKAADNGPEEAKIAYNSILFENVVNKLKSTKLTADGLSSAGDQFYELAKFAYDRGAYNDANRCYNGAVNCYYGACYGQDGSDTSKSYEYPACQKFIQLKHGDELSKFSQVIDGMNNKSIFGLPGNIN